MGRMGRGTDSGELGGEQQGSKDERVMWAPNQGNSLSFTLRLKTQKASEGLGSDWYGYKI